MNWSRIKSILIAVFIIVDAYLVFQYFKINETDQIVSPATIENTVSYMETNGITVKEDAIPRITEKNQSYKSSADLLVAFTQYAKAHSLTPCTVNSITLSEGVWNVSTDKGEYSFNAETLAIIK